MRRRNRRRMHLGGGVQHYHWSGGGPNAPSAGTNFTHNLMDHSRYGRKTRKISKRYQRGGMHFGGGVAHRHPRGDSFHTNKFSRQHGGGVGPYGSQPRGDLGSSGYQG